LLSFNEGEFQLEGYNILLSQHLSPDLAPVATLHSSSAILFSKFYLTTAISENHSAVLRRVLCGLIWYGLNEHQLQNLFSQFIISLRNFAATTSINTKQFYEPQTSFFLYLYLNLNLYCMYQQ
jgi:hypothetical protein